MKSLSSTIFLLFLFSAVFSQGLKTITVKTSETENKEVFQVLKKNRAIKHGSFQKYSHNTLLESGYYKNNKKDSIWNVYSQKRGQLIASGKYSGDTLVGIWTYYSKAGVVVQKYDHDIDSLIYFDVIEESKILGYSIHSDTASEHLPIFIGGATYMMTFIENSLVYPKNVSMGLRNIKVVISFIVEKDGSVSNVNSLLPVAKEFEDEGIRLVKLLDKSWIPCVQNGKKVRVQYNLPMIFNPN